MKTLLSSLCFIITIIMMSKQNLSAQYWSLSGNNLSGNERLGTINNTDLRIFTNNQRRMTIKANGRVGIGINNPAWRLDVNGSLNIAFDSSIRSGGAKILTNLYNSQNTFIGYGAGYNTNPIDNITGSRNTFAGWNAGDSNINGSYNSYYGSEAGLYTTGNSNTFIGQSAGEYTYGGSYNTFVGRGAGLLTAAGSYNCFIGDSAGWGSKGNENVYIGHLAAAPVEANLFNSTAIGSRASVTANNSMMFGNSAVNFWGFGITTPVASQAFKVGSSSSNGNGAYLTTGGVWTDISDRKKKDNITQLDKRDVLDKINKLEVAKWKYRGSGNEYHVGPMADDFYKLFEVGNDSAISAMDKTGVLFLGVKALTEKNNSLEAIVKEQQLQIEKQEIQIKALVDAVNKLSGGQSFSFNTEHTLSTNIKQDDIKLDQNIPNPLTNTSSISYSVPQNVKNVQLLITTSSGKSVKQFKLTPGSGVVTIDASSLSSGTYNYSLLVDGKIIESKKMVVAH